MSKLVYVVEDDENIRELVKMALSSFSYTVRAFDNAEDALSAVAAEIVPDLVIFDIMLPKMSGLDATKALRQNLATKRLPIVLLTAKDTEMDKVSGLDCGADDYITKPFSVMELGARLRSVLRRCANERETEISSATEISDFVINTQTREVTKNGKIIDMTFKEYELFRTLTNARNRIVSREELLNTVWGFDFMGETRTLDVHIRTLRGKLGDDTENPKYIKTIRNIGYRFIGK